MMNIYKSNMYGEFPGPAKIKRYTFKLNNDWNIINVPKDIPKNTAKNIVDNFLSRILSITIPSSLRCNLNCDYCYIKESWLKKIDVPIETIKMILDMSINKILYYNKNNKNGFNITSYGAEPLCNIDALELLVDTCIKEKIHINFSTNGTIINNRVKEILIKIFKHKLAKNIQISLDGPANIQNLHRKTIDGKNTFDSVMKFIEMLNDIQNELGIKHRLYTINGVIELNDKTPELFVESAKWFSDKNCPVHSRIIPIRIENSPKYDKKYVEIFVETIKNFYDFAKEYYSSTGLGIIDHYTSRLFLNTNRIDGCVNCSAMRTEIAIDIDGSLYMCHGPITSSSIKPYTQFGNVIDGYIDFSALISNIDYTLSDKLYASICKNCELILDSDVTGLLCYNCPINNLIDNKNSIGYNYFRCMAYKNSFKYFKEIAKLYKKSEENITNEHNR